MVFSSKNDLDWHWKHTARIEYIKCIIWLFVWKTSSVPLFFSWGRCADTWIALSYLFIASLALLCFFCHSSHLWLTFWDRAIPSHPFPLAVFLPPRCDRRYWSNITVSKDDDYPYHSCCYSTPSPLIPACHPSVSPSYSPILTFPLKCHTAPSAPPHGEWVHIIYPP